MIRTAADADVPALVELLLRGHVESPRWGVVPVDEAKLAAGIASYIPSGGVFMAERDGEAVGVLIGTAAAYWFSDAGYASNVQFYVAKQARARTVGVRLIQAFEAWAIGLGVSEVRLSVDAAINDATAVRLFKAMGYSQTCASYTKIGLHAESASAKVATSSGGGP